MVKIFCGYVGCVTSIHGDSKLKSNKDLITSSTEIFLKQIIMRNNKINLPNY